MIAVNTSYTYQGVHLRVSGEFDPSVPTWRKVRVRNPDTEKDVVLPDVEYLLALDKLSQAAGVAA